MAITLYDQMLERNISVAELAKRVEVTYEAVRRIAGGSQPPSKRLLKDICVVLGLDFQTVDNMRKAEQIRRKHGALPPELTNKNPELQPIEDLWDFLTLEDKEQIIHLVRYHAERRLTRGRVAPSRLASDRSQRVRTKASRRLRVGNQPIHALAAC